MDSVAYWKEDSSQQINRIVSGLVVIADAAERLVQFYSDYNQYLNCKILRGGTLLQPWPNAFGMRKYFSEDYVIPSPKLNEHQKKKVFAEN